MTLIFLIGLAYFSVAVVLIADRSSGNGALIQPLDVVAFRTLMDRKDEMFLRKNLSLADFHPYQTAAYPPQRRIF